MCQSNLWQSPLVNCTAPPSIYIGMPLFAVLCVPCTLHLLRRRRPLLRPIEEMTYIRK
jgi:hypothetical protein